MKGKDKERYTDHAEGSTSVVEKKKRPLLYEGPVASILNALFISTRLDFPPEAFHRTVGGTKERPIHFTPDQIKTRHRVLDDMLAASSMRDKEVTEVCLNSSEIILVQEEFKETVDASGVIMLTEHYDYAKHMEPEYIATAASEGRNSSGLKRADAVMLVGIPFLSLIHLNTITKGFHVVFKKGACRVVLLSFDPEDAELQRQEIKKRAASKGYTYSIRIEHEPDLKAKALAEAKQTSAIDEKQ